MTGLKLAKIVNGFSTEELAIKIGVTRPIVSAWENDTTTIPKKRIKDLIKILDVSADFLIASFSKEEVKAMFNLRHPSNEEILEVIKKEFPKTDAVYEEKLISLIGNGAFERLKDAGHIKLCGEIGGKKLYAI